MSQCYEDNDTTWIVRILYNNAMQCNNVPLLDYYTRRRVILILTLLPVCLPYFNKSTPSATVT